MIPLTKGKILLQAEGAEILYRNIEIKHLSEQEQYILYPNSQALGANRQCIQNTINLKW